MGPISPNEISAALAEKRADDLLVFHLEQLTAQFKRGMMTGEEYKGELLILVLSSLGK